MDDKLRTLLLSSAPFYVAALALITWSLVNTYLLTITPGEASPWMDRLFFFLGLVFFALPSLLNSRNRALSDFETVLREVLSRTGDLEAVRREHYKARTLTEGLVEKVRNQEQELCQIVSRFSESVQVLPRIEQELVTNRQELGNSRRQAKAWEDAAISYYQILERILSHEGLPAHYRDYVEKTVDDFSRLVGPLGLHLVRPRLNDLFNGNDCVIEEALPTKEVPVDRIVRCTAWGFQRSSGEIIRAKVVVASHDLSSPPPTPSEKDQRTSILVQPGQGPREGNPLNSTIKSEPSAARTRSDTPLRTISADGAQPLEATRKQEDLSK